MRVHRSATLLLAALLAPGLAAASDLSTSTSGASTSGCARDADCKGDRVCFEGRCLTADAASELEREQLRKLKEQRTSPTREPQDADAEAASPSYLIELNTVPVRTRAALDEEGGWYATPVTFRAAVGPHSIKLKAPSGFSNAVVSALVGASDLRLEVDLDRPVFEAGVGLAVTAGVLIIGAIVQSAVINDDYDGKTAIWVSQLVGGCAVGIVGGLMIGLDRQRGPVVRVFAGGKPTAPAEGWTP